MWGVMSECHRLQYRIMAVALGNNTKVSVFTESRRHITVHLENELTYLSLHFTKWISAQEAYFHAINGWLIKCVPLLPKPSKKKKRTQAVSWRNSAPPIYAICDVWLSKLHTLQSRELVDSITSLAAETRKFLPQQEKSQGKGAKRPLPSWGADNVGKAVPGTLMDEAPEDLSLTFDRFHSSLVEFLGKLSEYSESAVIRYRELKGAIMEAKNKYEWLMSRPKTSSLSG